MGAGADGLERHAPGLTRVALGSAPTPVRRLELGFDAEVWVKDEGRFGDGAWGGNKVRKLEWIIPEAHRRGVRTLLTVGGIGTHWGLACARYGAEHGLRTVLGLVDQPVDDHVREQLARLESSGARLHRFTTARRLRLAAPYLLARYRPWYLPAGGSNAVGALAYVDVAWEVAAQVAAGELPEPAALVVPVGSGGTVAGLALGLRWAGLRTRVVGVVVNDMVRLDAATVGRLVARTRALLLDRGASGVPEVRPADLDLRPDWLGATYGDPTPASMAEVARVAASPTAGVDVEPVYTGKALAAVRALTAAGASGRRHPSGPGITGPVLWLATHGPRD